MVEKVKEAKKDMPLNDEYSQVIDNQMRLKSLL